MPFEEMELATKIAVLQGDVNRTQVVIGKIEATMERLGEVSNSVARILAVHDEKINQHQETHTELFMLTEQHKNDAHAIRTLITNVQKELEVAIKSSGTEIKVLVATESAKHQKVEEDHEKRLRELERRQWKLVGATAIGTFLLSLLGPWLLKMFSGS